jgi:hypothetical protein
MDSPSATSQSVALKDDTAYAKATTERIANNALPRRMERHHHAQPTLA